MRLAGLLRVALAVQLALGALFAGWLLPDGSPWWLVPAAAPLVPVGGTLLVLGIELAVAALVDPRRPRAPAAHVLRVWLGETACSLRVFGWRQPFASGFPEPPVVADPQRPALLLVHGYLCNRAVWKPLLASGVLSGCNVATVNLEPVFGPIERYAEPIDAAVRRLQAASGAARVILVAHSMGGLAARAYLQRHGDAAVARVITLASPHRGTLFGALGHGANAQQMARDSGFLKTLAAAETAERRRRFVCIATADDNLVVPRTSPLLPDAEHHLLDGVGHLALIEDRRAWALIRQAAGAAGTPSAIAR